MKYFRGHIILVLSVLFFISCSDSQKKRPDIKNGFLDFSSWNFEKDGLVNLNGPCEFYWEKLLQQPNKLSKPEALISTESA